MAGAVGGVAGALHGGLAVVPRVAAEPTLVDLAVGRPVEREAHPLEVQYRVDRFLAHDVDGVLVREEVATLHRVERVPLPRVLFDVRERRAHPALCGARVGPGGVELGDDCRLAPLAGFESGSQARSTGADDDGVVLMCPDRQVSRLEWGRR